MNDSKPRDIRIEPLDRVQIEILRRMTAEQRLRFGLEWSDFVRDTVRARIGDQHPDWTEAEISAEMLRAFHGVEL